MEDNKLVGDGGQRTLYTAGWRPAVGWVCVLGLLWNFIGYSAVALYVGVENAPPPINTQSLYTLLFALLGLGGFRTFEKINNKAK